MNTCGARPALGFHHRSTSPAINRRKHSIYSIIFLSDKFHSLQIEYNAYSYLSPSSGRDGGIKTMIISYNTYVPPWSKLVGCIQFLMGLFWTGATGSSFMDGGSGLLRDETGGAAVMNMYNRTKIDHRISSG